MKHSPKTTCAFLFLLICCYTIKAQSKADQDAAMKAWQAYSTPGDIHKMIAKADGEWKSEMTYWMAPGTQPMKSSGTCVNRMILGGRYQETKQSGSIMDMPFEGVGIMGYDNARKVFMLSWVDNMGTGIMNMEGTWDEATQSLTLTGKQPDPVSGKDMSMRQVIKWIDDNNEVMEMYSTMDGKEFKNLEIKYTRK